MRAFDGMRFTCAGFMLAVGAAKLASGQVGAFEVASAALELSVAAAILVAPTPVWALPLLVLAGYSVVLTFGTTTQACGCFGADVMVPSGVRRLLASLAGAFALYALKRHYRRAWPAVSGN